MQLPNDIKHQHEDVSEIKYVEAYKASMVALIKESKRMTFVKVECHRTMFYQQFRRVIMEKMKKWNITEDDFKSCLNGLIENDYIERDGTFLCYV